MKYAVSHVGIQDDGTWVLGPNVCISPKGEIVSAEDCCHMWIGDLFIQVSELLQHPSNAALSCH